jgi:hypothetical protein
MCEKMFRATHQGKLEIGEKEIPCAVLENGTRVISQGSVFQAFGRPQRGISKDGTRMLNMPAFLDAKNLLPYIDDELREKIVPIKYKNKNGRESIGYDAIILPMVCNVYLQARMDGVLTRKQPSVAIASEILVRSLSKIGIIALVDEATGYQYDRQRDELQKILKAYISEELLPWSKRFPDEFYKEMFRLNGWTYNPIGAKRPGIIGKYTNKLIYEKLPDGVLDELKSKTPKNNSGKFTRKLHQSLTLDIGNTHLEKQLISVITLMNVSSNWRNFLALFAKKFGGQLELFEED